jgi:hypothetical protein
VLAEVMGNYTLKARCFARIKLFNFVSNSIVAVVGHYEKGQKVSRSSPPLAVLCFSASAADRWQLWLLRRFDMPGRSTTSA